MASDYRPCPVTGKVCYRGPGEAKRAHRHAKFRIRAYRCNHCGQFHVTNGEKRHQQGRREEE